MNTPFEDALPEVPFENWEMTQSGYYPDGAVYYFEDDYWELRVNCINNRIAFKQKGHANSVSVEARSPIVTRAYGVMLYINSCYDVAMNQTV